LVFIEDWQSSDIVVLECLQEDIHARWQGLARHAEVQGQEEAEALEALERDRRRALQRVRAKDEEDQRGM
jgi:hypothetical protein